MADNVLYFPYICVPNNEWFTRVLLYWDEVGSIVPDEYIRRPEELGSHMTDLLQEGLVRQVIPYDHIPKIPRFSEAFIDLVDNNPVVATRRDIPLKRQPTFQIHMQKLGNVAAGLCDRGLARAADYPWYEVERFTGMQFMAYLAAVLGQLKELAFVPATDEVQYLEAFSSEEHTEAARTVLKERLRATVLEGILPAPAEGVGASELARFKSHYADLLHRFRGRIESLVVDVAATHDLVSRTERLHLIRDELGDEIEELGARMRESRWPRIVFGTFCGLLASAMPGAAALATGNIPVAGAAVPGLLKAIYSAFSGSRRQSEIMRSPLAYAALAQKRLASR